jgi:hypothetical protein
MSLEPFDLSIEEIRNPSATVEKYKTLMRQGDTSEATRRKLKKAAKLKEEEDFNRQYFRR